MNLEKLPFLCPHSRNEIEIDYDDDVIHVKTVIEPIP